MATKFQFAGRTVRLPGVYSQIVSGRNNPPLDLDYGRVLVIASSDHDIRGGAGIGGELSSGKDSIYELRTLREFQDFVGQGMWYKAGEGLFKPNRFNPGVSRVFVVKPFSTTASTLELDLTAGTDGGTLNLKTLDEGTPSIGSITTIDGTDYLDAGYAFTVEAGIRNAAKWILKFWLSTYRGALTSDGYPINEVTEQNATPKLIAQSIEFDDMTDLIAWAEEDKALNSYFQVVAASTSVKGTGAVDGTEMGGKTGYQLAVGATQTADKFDDMLEAIKDLDYNLVMYVSGTDVDVDADTIKLVSHLETDAKYDKFLVAGGHDSDLDLSIGYSEAFNTDKVIMPHGGIKKRSRLSPTGLRTWSSMLHAAYITGRLAGLPPQVPITFKALDVDGVVDNVNELEREDALDAGVLITYFDNDRGLHVVEQGVNTLQDNDFTLNPDGTSHVVQIKRIAAQLNKELIVNAKRDLLSNPNGVNRNTLSEQDVIDWTKVYLSRKIATDDIDNLILSFQDVTVERIEDSYQVTYAFEPNSEIRLLFFTGFML